MKKFNTTEEAFENFHAKIKIFKEDLLKAILAFVNGLKKLIAFS